MHWDVWQIWMAVALGLVILEIFVPGFVLACLGVGALAAAGAASLSWSLTIQFALAALFSLLSFVFLRPLAMKFAFSGNEAVSGVEALVGRECRVSQPFDADSGMGRCKIDGDDWRATLVHRDQAAEAFEHAAVWIVRVESNTLVVSTQPPVV
ncbi:MAG: NfeD family protein [Bacteroidetes bacterium]|nr:NfeD family protein [Bacteroidota bacterium]MDA0904110.1 NfeD family protein [Bacteroidota bacterium]MDA1243124.1 NfeD family protein [Bacteroidota bacterium]